MHNSWQEIVSRTGRDKHLKSGVAALVQLPGAEGIAAIEDFSVPSGPSDPLNTVGLALLAYGLVQLLSRLLDRLPIGKMGSDRRDTVVAASDEDGKRLQRLVEVSVADGERLRRLEEMVKDIAENTRWLSDQRTRTDPRDGEPIWNCRGHAILDQLNTQQRLTGQALDNVREIDKKLENLLRKMRTLWERISRRSKDQP